MLKRLRRALLLASFLAQPALGADCGAVDYMAMALPGGPDPVVSALTLAYPALKIADGQITLPNGTKLPLGADDNRPPKDRLENPTVREQFHDRYPLSFDLHARDVPWFDPGRPRVEALFQGLYGDSQAKVKASLQKTSIKGHASFLITSRENAACQMAAALAEVQALKTPWQPFFKTVGGSFNWRKIAGTERYSTHSYGIAFDLNSKLGGYWRWSNRPEGDAGPYDNKLPEDIVRIFERRGFIWGGKWHHFDGMHFEYRPELILYARMKAQ
jgi:hypothetical protein